MTSKPMTKMHSDLLASAESKGGLPVRLSLNRAQAPEQMRDEQAHLLFPGRRLRTPSGARGP